MNSEVLFLIEDADEGGFNARCVGHSIFTQAETMEQLRANIREAVECHFDPEQVPKSIRLQIIHQEVLTA